MEMLLGQIQVAEEIGAPLNLCYCDVFRWNVEFFARITKKYLILLNADGRF